MVVIMVLFSRTCGLTCTQKDLCSCSMEDGSGDIDVSTLGSQDGNPMFKDMTSLDGSLYSLNLCYPFNELSCTNAAACQISLDRSTSFPVGDATNVGFQTDDLDQVHVIYTNIDSTGATRTTDVRMICSPSSEPPLVTANGQTGSGSLFYEFLLYSKCGCPGQCSGTPPFPGKGAASGDISIGTIVVIGALSLGFLYLIGGILFMKMVRRAHGSEVVPNVSFWRGLPGLIKDGCLFTTRKYRKDQYNKI
ncbi:Cation-dependent mannose-6-phosphate receptor [Mizuhopecten yessoensis]|uniref:Cation-dependent mannose-6-phosphate receptor n=2 Tax=Mizuhopecten yessoensis TaxID=6573 RepID=A0A210PF62_MIZYE|nr:Cation-dependent mannose-6-phosphate receptor [Mizuhopecten yessoensis]